MPGALTGLTKEEANHRYGSDKVLDWRRGWDQRPPALDQEDPRHPSQDPILVERLPRGLPAPSTECFKDVAGRVLPFLENRIMPELRAGKTVLVTAHGNPIRAIAQLLEEGSCRENPKFEVPNTTPMVYSFGPDLAVMSATVPSASGGPSKRGCYLGKRTTVEADLEAFQRYLERGCCPANSWPVHEVQAD
jgi:bisphosphoglycerate-dependent phosphoglycerate mutase family 1